ncbi:hypothetical protein TNCV_4321461 [Trichonephila clavipes]|uniref:Uncharacterized protein n=1 Tax=Trichonephila clavipes TaxID=2585209 RepID=A0A8X6S8Q6_TRICX|nr:hypothetical protein TNCV_4321461 [Trichonephila clavipes]
MVCGWKGAIAPDKYSRRIHCGWIFRAGHPSSNFLCERGGVVSQILVQNGRRRKRIQIWYPPGKIDVKNRTLFRALKAQTVLKNEQNVGFRCGLRQKHSLAD